MESAEDIVLNSEYEVIFDALEREEKERFFSSDEAVVDGQKALPQIVVTGRPLRDISADSLHALRQANQNPTMFVRTGEMVHIVTDESGGP